MIGLFTVLSGFVVPHQTVIYHPTDGKAMVRALEAALYPNPESRPLSLIAPDGLYGFHCQPSGIGPYLDVAWVSYRPAHWFRCWEFEDQSYRMCIGTADHTEAVRKKYSNQQLKALRAVHQKLLTLPNDSQINSSMHMIIVSIGNEVRVYDADHLPARLQSLAKLLAGLPKVQMLWPSDGFTPH